MLNSNSKTEKANERRTSLRLWHKSYPQNFRQKPRNIPTK